MVEILVNGLTTEYAVCYVNVRMLKSMKIYLYPLRKLVNLFTNIANVVVGYGQMKS